MEFKRVLFRSRQPAAGGGRLFDRRRDRAVAARSPRLGAAPALGRAAALATPAATAPAQSPRLPARGRQVTLPLAHHSALVALPVFAPALVVILVLLVHRLREG